RKRAEDLVEEVRKGLGEKTSQGQTRDLETVSIDKGARSAHKDVEKSGRDLPAELKATEVVARLEGGRDKRGGPSPAVENGATTGSRRSRGWRTRRSSAAGSSGRARWGTWAGRSRTWTGASRSSTAGSRRSRPTRRASARRRRTSATRSSTWPASSTTATGSR